MDAEQAPPRPEPLDEDVLGLVALNLLLAARVKGDDDTLLAAQEDLKNRWEAQLDGAQGLSVDDFKQVAQAYFRERRWRWCRNAAGVFQESRFWRRLQEAYDEVVKIWADVHKIKAHLKIAQRVAFVLGDTKFFGTVRGLDKTRALYVIDPDPRVLVEYRDDLRTIQRRTKTLILLPWEDVEECTAELRVLN